MEVRISREPGCHEKRGVQKRQTFGTRVVERVTPSEFFKTLLHLEDCGLIQALSDASVPLHLRRGELLVREGSLPDTVPMLVRGIVRGFYFDEDGQEITDCFAVQAGSPVMATARLRIPSPLYLDVLTDSDFLAVPIPEVQRLLDEYPELLRLYNRLLIQSFSTHWEIKAILRRGTAMQRYQWFLSAYPGLIDRISNKYVASFLGMTPVTLSRLRRILREQADADQTAGERRRI